MGILKAIANVLSVVTVAIVLLFGVLMLAGWAFLTMGQDGDYLP